MAKAMLGWSNGVGDRWTGGSEAAFGLLEQVNTWVWVLAVLGVGKAFLGRSGGRVPRYASEGSYPFYLLHQTVIVAVGYVVVGWGIGVWPAFAAVVGGAPGHRPRYRRAMSRPLMADAFGHHVWATLRLIDACLALDPEQLDTAAPGTYGSILDTMRHVVGADTWYLFSLTGGRTPAID